MSISVPRLEALPAKGNYTLIIFLKASTDIKMAGRRYVSLKKGYYSYTGSALGSGATSLRKRVARHLRKKKNQHWHIDHLLASKRSKVIAVVAAASEMNKECEIASLLQRLEGATVPITGFGASDCKGRCRSHLMYFEKDIKPEAVADVYKSIFTDVRTLVASSPQPQLKV
ncbi:MAG TPA: GIY-YIG nuclease family protein [Candidatus Bathyarchaeia archaeon]|nr:GIY-YIG nuclease family protein [Candidatus Bathyarchaeia archaeon]